MAVRSAARVTSHSPPCQFLLRRIPVEVKRIALTIINGKRLAAFRYLTARKFAGVRHAIKREDFNLSGNSAETILRVTANWKDEHLWLPFRSPHNTNNDLSLL